MDIELAPGESKEIDAEVLNTITCQLTGKNMNCEIEGREAGDYRNFGTVKDVFSVGGDITVLEGHAGSIWIKSYPYIGESCKIRIRNRSETDFPPGKDIVVECEGT